MNVLPVEIVLRVLFVVSYAFVVVRINIYYL